MNFRRLKYIAVASSLVLPLAAADVFAHGSGYGKSYGKSCGYHGWHHPHGYGMSQWKGGHGYGPGMGYGHSKRYGKGYDYGMGHRGPHHGYGYPKGMGYGKGMYGHHPMSKTGGYGYGPSKAGGYRKAQNEAAAASEKVISEKDIVDTALSAGSFTTLVEAVKAAGLVETLRGEGPFTVFAPTDEAFAKLPPETLNALLQDKKQLTAVLTYHVAPGSLRAASVVDRDSIKTVQGQSLTVTADDAGVRVDEAKYAASIRLESASAGSSRRSAYRTTR